MDIQVQERVFATSNSETNGNYVGVQLDDCCGSEFQFDAYNQTGVAVFAGDKVTVSTASVCPFFDDACGNDVCEYNGLYAEVDNERVFLVEGMTTTNFNEEAGIVLDVSDQCPDCDNAFLVIRTGNGGYNSSSCDTSYSGTVQLFCNNILVLVNAFNITGDCATASVENLNFTVSGCNIALEIGLANTGVTPSINQDFCEPVVIDVRRACENINLDPCCTYRGFLEEDIDSKDSGNVSVLTCGATETFFGSKLDKLRFLFRGFCIGSFRRLL